ncbi:MAG: acetate kinase [Candidatus Firestonebacteria bacterium]
MKILVINCGSSSIKYQLYEMPEKTVLAKGLLEKIATADSVLTHQVGEKKISIKKAVKNHEEGMKLIVDTLLNNESGVIKNINEISGIGHRVVHGGESFPRSAIITDEVVKIIESYFDLAPLHNPPNLTGIKASASIFGSIPQVAAFDTAFHQTIPKVAYLYALPYEIYEKYKVRRYGFHGTSHRYVARRACVLMNKDKDKANIITAHLGNGCSITAVEKGKSVDTSMGLTPLEGLVMGTRSGDIDPAIIFYLEGKGYKIDDINTLLNKKSGLIGVSGASNDVRDILELANKGNERAKLAIDIFCYRVKKYIGAYTAVLGRVDALVFTGGIGENAITLRWKICENLTGVGIELDKEKNDKTIKTEAKISSINSKVDVFVIPTNEEVRIAVDTYELVKSS